MRLHQTFVPAAGNLHDRVHLLWAVAVQAAGKDDQINYFTTLSILRKQRTYLSTLSILTKQRTLFGNLTKSL